MALDTAAKRRTMLRMSGTPVLFIADGAIGAIDRALLLGVYYTGGISVEPHLFLGSQAVADLKLGSDSVAKLYLGATQAWP